MPVIGSRLHSVWTRVAGLDLHAQVSASAPNPAGAPAFVLVHGLGVSGRYLMPTAERLARDGPTFVPDLPGFGQSDKPAHILTIPELADALAAWVRAAGPERATYVGNSLGCQTILDFALRYPEHIERAVLIGPTMDPRAPTMLGQAWRGLLDLPRERLSLWPIVMDDYLTAGAVRTVVTLRHGLRDPVREKLARVQVPTLVVRGERDPIAPQPWVEEVCRRLPQARLVVIAGAAHAVNYSAPDALARAVRAFVEDEPAAAVPSPMPQRLPKSLETSEICV